MKLGVFLVVSVFFVNSAYCQGPVPVCHVDTTNNCSAMLLAQTGKTGPMTCNHNCVPVWFWWSCPKPDHVDFHDDENPNQYLDVRQAVGNEQGRIGTSQIQSPIMCATIGECLCERAGQCQTINLRQWAPVESSANPNTAICP